MTNRLVAYALLFTVAAAVGFSLARPASAATRVAVVVKTTPVHYDRGVRGWYYAPPVHIYPRGYFAPRPYSYYRLRPSTYRYWLQQQRRHRYTFKDRDHDRYDGRNRHLEDHDRHDRHDGGPGRH